MEEVIVDNIQGSVERFEDSCEPGQAPITHYIISIKFSGKVFELRKRYSEFADLHQKLKLKYPEIDEFRFPNKSILNTHAPFTKERRLRGFDEYVKLLCKLKPIDAEVAEFLQLNKVRTSSSSAQRDESATTSQNRLDSSNNATHMTRGNKENISKGSGLSEELLSYTISSFIIVAPSYFILIYLGLVDVTHSTISRIALTTALLGFALSISRFLINAMLS